MRIGFNPTTGEFDLLGPRPARVERVSDFYDTDLGTSVGDLVVIDSDNKVIKITDNLTSTMPQGIFGIVFRKPTSITAEVVFLGKCDLFSGLVTKKAYFVSVTGGLTDIPPATGMVQQVGKAINSTTLVINLMQPMRRA